MNSLALSWIIPSVTIILGGIFKLFRQGGRIEEGVKGLYSRVERIEREMDRRGQYFRHG